LVATRDRGIICPNRDNCRTEKNSGRTRQLNLLPCPRSLKILRDTFTLPKEVGVQALACSGDTLKRELQRVAIKVVRTHSAPDHPEGCALAISKIGIEISFRATAGLRASAEVLN
jgi:hypothetical protein